MFKAHMKLEREENWVPSPHSTYATWLFVIPALLFPKIIGFGNASALFQGGINVGFEKFFVISQKYFPPTTSIHKQHEEVLSM